MPVEERRFPNEPIIVLTLQPPLTMPDDPKQTLEIGNKFAAEHDGPVYRIIDFSNVELTFEQITVGLAEDTRNADSDTIGIIVGSGELVKLGVEAAKQEQYGGHELPFFESVDEAVAYAREHRAQNS